MARVNVKIPDDVHTKAKLISILKRQTLNDFLEKAIASAVEKDKSIIKKLGDKQ